MFQVLIPNDPAFCIYESRIKNLYEKSQDKICDTNSFDFIKNNTLFYLFVVDYKPIGAIYYFMEQGKLFLNGFAIRKNLKNNLFCLLLSTSWFSSDIYAEAQNKASAFCLLKCGFKRVKDNLFCLRKNKNF